MADANFQDDTLLAQNHFWFREPTLTNGSQSEAPVKSRNKSLGNGSKVVGELQLRCSFDGLNSRPPHSDKWSQNWRTITIVCSLDKRTRHRRAGLVARFRPPSLSL